MAPVPGSPVEAFTAAFFEELARAGVQHVVVSPGSRSTPLVIAADRTAGLRTWVQLDERSAGFFALGLGKRTGRAAALVCTSGTAAANYLPAVVEAHYARVPLLVLTADRPPELREWGAGQTIDQRSLYGGHVRWFVELPVPDAAVPLRYARSLAARALDAARGGRGGGAGPAHLNWPLREPLEPGLAPGTPERPREPLGEAGRGPAPFARTQRAVPTLSPEAAAGFADRVAASPRGVIVAGPGPPDPALGRAVCELARASGWPVLADGASPLRTGAHVVDAPVVGCADLLLRSGAFGDSAAPDTVLRLGGPPVGKALRLWLERHPPADYVMLDPDGGWDEPSHLASRVVRADPAVACAEWARQLAAARPARDGAWLAGWRAAEAEARAVLGDALADAPLLEPEVVRVLQDACPEGSTLYASNSMPIRDVDAFLEVRARALPVLANRGANGIDGVTSSALGAAASGLGRVVLLTGDLALLHDLPAWLIARRETLPLTVVVLDNDGGGIFSFLPIARHGEAVSFERLFRTPEGIDARRIAALFDCPFERAETAPALARALAASHERPGPSLIAVPIDRDANVARFRALAARVAEAVAPHCAALEKARG